jgi:hypothetical protein
MQQLIRPLFFFTALLCLLSSCKKIQEDLLLEGTWKLTAYYLDTMQTNFMENVLPDYKNCTGRCEYIIDFKENEQLEGRYYTFDSLRYIKSGIWQNLEYEKIYIKLDNYVDGDYYISRYDAKNYMLISNNNLFFNARLRVRLMVEKL